MAKQLFFYALLFFQALLMPVAASAQKVTFKDEAEMTQAAQSVSKLQGTQLADRYFEICFWYIFNKNDQTDKIKTYAVEGKQLSDKLNYGLGKGKYALAMAHLYQIQHDYPNGKKASSLAIAIFDKQKSFDLLGEAWVMLWSNHCLSGLPYEKRNPYLFRAAIYFKKAGNLKREGDCYKEAGDVCQLLGQGAEALQYLKKAAALYQKAHYDQLHTTYDLLGSVYNSLGDYKEAIRYGLLAVRTAEKLKDDSMLMCPIYNRLGSSYVQIEQFDPALNYYNKALGYAERYQDIVAITTMVFNIAEVQISQHKTDEALTFTLQMLRKHPDMKKVDEGILDCLLVHLYLMKQNFPLAKKHAAGVEKMLSVQKLNYISYTNSLNMLIPLYLGSSDLKRAEFWIARYDSVSKLTDSEINRDKLLYWKFKMDSIKGDYKGAIRRFQEFKIWTDKVLIESKSRQINQLNVLYETEKKDKDILLLTKRTQIQNDNLAKEKLIRNIILGSLISVIIILFLLYKGYRLKQRSNMLLQKQQAEINDKNKSLEHLLQEKEWLLREIHHRVKNNLHMVTGLLESQTEFIKGKEARRAIADSQHRVQAMSLIHQKLYQTENLSMTDMPSYITELVDYLQQASESGDGVRFMLDIDKVDFPLSHTVPIGLILNEAITNAMKYAFPNRREKIVGISLKEQEDNSFVLEVSDNGVGLPDGFDLHNPNSLGTRLIYGLSLDIHADIEMFSDKGTHIVIRFSLPTND
ncbi:histidine kinase dimerization/phosphoacceptor domain -containing protein [Flavobacterium silvaticum]|uniref:histidine kinase n=1 Tax=Flavobacterium silvaticum TaxID=1852020 RepID=A0A972FNR9_9FLAO|nr:histidine kinase dimerization/phosphoacceptor domain -containing protein [Flavobacterium silvaticum]NMH28630.1 tetratricopeptide repeat protein [Flavobacterium silvaticum]